VNLFGGEVAMVSGPLSFQGEYFLLFADSDEADSPGFWGFYLYGSYFITGEHRNYDRSNGVFSGIKPKSDFPSL
jgi:phosphate-selective porin OprO/OprP